MEAVRKMDAGAKYDLVLMDIIMPNLDGVSATHLIRQFDSTPIIAMTSNIRSDDISMYFSHGKISAANNANGANLTHYRHERRSAETLYKRRSTLYAREAPFPPQEVIAPRLGLRASFASFRSFNWLHVCTD